MINVLNGFIILPQQQLRNKKLQLYISCDPLLWFSDCQPNIKSGNIYIYMHILFKLL